MRRELGPMFQAECRALARPEGSAPTQDHPVLHDPTEPEPDTPARWYNAIIPIAVTVSMVVLLIILNGRQNFDPSSTTNWWIQVFGSADPAIALQYGALAGLTVASLLALVQRLLTSEQVVQAAFAGARFILPAFAILWFASSLSRMTGNQPVHALPDDGTEYPYRATRLYTGEFLQQALLDSDSATSNEAAISETRARHLRHWLPTIIFTLAAAVSFCTGTSFGTMGLLVPMTLSLACAIAGPNAGQDPFVYLCLGGVLAGSIFGDHCSPISDTTVLSSQASGCDHVAHVWTQFPYAIVAGLLSIFLGTIPMGFGVPLLVLYPLQVVAMAAILWFAGKEAHA
jgi:Na+/H+ antiporter NhaC